MTAPWSQISLSEVLKLREPDTVVVPTERYRFAGVYSFGRGVFVGQEKFGAAFSYRVLTKLRRNEFVYPKLMAWEGAFGVVPESCHGCYVSPEFPVFEINEAKVLPHFLGFYFMNPKVWTRIAGGSIGTNVRRRRLYPDQFLQQTMALPSLHEQKRIVDQLISVAAGVGEVVALRGEATQLTSRLWSRGAADILDQAFGQFPKVELGELLKSVRGGGTPSKTDPRYWNGAIPWITPKDMKRRELSDSLIRVTDDAVRETPSKLIEPGAVLVVVRGMILAHTFPSAVLRRSATINQDMKALMPGPRLLPEFLCTVLWSRNSDLIELVDRSTHDTRKFDLDKLLAYQLPVPPLAEQHSIVLQLDALQGLVSDLQRLQAETASELEAMLPAILDEVFGGHVETRAAA